MKKIRSCFIGDSHLAPLANTIQKQAKYSEIFDATFYACSAWNKRKQELEPDQPLFQIDNQSIHPNNDMMRNSFVESSGQSEGSIDLRNVELIVLSGPPIRYWRSVQSAVMVPPNCYLPAGILPASETNFTPISDAAFKQALEDTMAFNSHGILGFLRQLNPTASIYIVPEPMISKQVLCEKTTKKLLKKSLQCFSSDCLKYLVSEVEKVANQWLKPFNATLLPRPATTYGEDIYTYEEYEYLPKNPNYISDYCHMNDRYGELCLESLMAHLGINLPKQTKTEKQSQPVS